MTSRAHEDEKDHKTSYSMFDRRDLRNKVQPHRNNERIQVEWKTGEEVYCRRTSKSKYQYTSPNGQMALTNKLVHAP